MKKTIQIYFWYFWHFLGWCKNIFLYGEYSPPHYYILEEKKSIYIANYKCGFSTIKQLLLDSEINIKIVRKLKNKYLTDKYTLFTVIRDPLERIVSCYLNNKENDNHITRYYLFWLLNSKSNNFNDFLEGVLKIPVFLQDRHFKAMYYNIGGKKIVTIIKVYLALENLDSDIAILNKKLKYSKLGKLNSSHDIKKEIISCIPDELLLKFKQKYKKDYFLLKKYNQEQKSWFKYIEQL